ncbi:glycerol-3-phosphate acyltransferase [Thermodesulfobacteriota bacterium]
MAAIYILIPVAYLAGSVNIGVLLFRAAGKPDPREFFSGNPGVFNIYRQSGPAWAGVVLALDTGRAALAAAAGLYFMPVEQIPFVGLALILGNRYPLFHGFQGGKGVANYLGFTMVIHPLMAGISAFLWVAVYKVARKAFVGSFAMVLVLAVGMIMKCGVGWGAVSTTLVTVGVIFWAHRPNVQAFLEKRTGTRG